MYLPAHPEITYLESFVIESVVIICECTDLLLCKLLIIPFLLITDTSRSPS